jgi:hypothetical protein|tara:strand:- start:667 stop:1278 length:612 start_codon:yes stop_codon:yes gene_type:complete
MRFGISNIIPIIFICLNFQLSYSQVTRVSDFKTSTFRDVECDDTEYRDDNGSPNWKNYGQWLSECDSLSDTYHDSVFAVQRAKKDREKAIQDSIDMASVEDIDFDLDAMWENTVWEEIQDVADAEVYETEYITAVAGVRGAEAEDEALALLYYRKSMRGLSKLQIQKALGKLIIRREKLSDDDSDAQKIDGYILQLKNKLKKV